MEHKIKEIPWIDRPVFPRATSGEIQSINRLSAILFVVTAGLMIWGRESGSMLILAIAVGTAWASGITFGIYDPDFGGYDADEIEDVDALRYEHSRDWE